MCNTIKGALIRKAKFQRCILKVGIISNANTKPVFLRLIFAIFAEHRQRFFCKKNLSAKKWGPFEMKGKYLFFSNLRRRRPSIRCHGDLSADNLSADNSPNTNLSADNSSA
jgi:hypothetical protein